MCRVSYPHHINADQAFHFNADPDPAFHFNADPDPAPHEGDANLRPLAYRPSRPPFSASTDLYGRGLQCFKLNGNQMENHRYLEKNNFLLFFMLISNSLMPAF
jgi:hypothetical protein